MDPAFATNEHKHDIDGRKWRQYEGQCENDMKNGKSICFYKDGQKYDGEWKDNKRSGYGVYTWPDGHKYEGEWKDGEESGYGVFTWPNGDKYEGQCRHAKLYDMRYHTSHSVAF